MFDSEASTDSPPGSPMGLRLSESPPGSPMGLRLSDSPTKPVDVAKPPAADKPVDVAKPPAADKPVDVAKPAETEHSAQVALPAPPPLRRYPQYHQDWSHKRLSDMPDLAKRGAAAAAAPKPDTDFELGTRWRPGGPEFPPTRPSPGVTPVLVTSAEKEGQILTQVKI